MEALNEHISMLEEQVFQTNSKWPHFSLLIKDLKELAATLAEQATVVSLERTLLYGGYSLFAPLFDKQVFLSIDCSPVSADERGAYNRRLVEDPRFIKIPTTSRASIEHTELPSELADLVIVPNLVHHVENQAQLFMEVARLVKPGGRVYVFEPLVRELHQIPDDYLRYTPYGLASQMKEVGLNPEPPRMEGGPFSVIAYCWTQALEYFPKEQRQEKEQWFYETHFKELMEWDKEHPGNHVRQHTTFPMSFSTIATKPGATL